jgi:hypothetical protein
MELMSSTMNYCETDTELCNALERVVSLLETRRTLTFAPDPEYDNMPTLSPRFSELDSALGRFGGWWVWDDQCFFTINY